MEKKYDFSGWATKANVRCSDGRTIAHDAFKDCDGEIVPLVWNHQHNDPNNILGNVLLKNMGAGVYAYGSFNNSESGKLAKMLVEHGDISSLSILANNIKQVGSDVVHGVIREVSLVLAGANPEACIAEVVTHGETLDGTTAKMFFNEPINTNAEEVENDEMIVEHAEKKTDSEETIGDIFDTLTDKQKDVVYYLIGKAIEGSGEDGGDNVEHAENNSDSEETIKDVFETLTDKQKEVVYALIGQAVEDAKSNDSEEDKEEIEQSEGGNNMKFNVFDKQGKVDDDTIKHSEGLKVIIDDAKRFGSMKESFIQHAATYGIENIEYLFPDDKNVTNTPIFIQRDTTWVGEFMNSVHHTPFSRIKSLFADITDDEARAKGYYKGKIKKEELFTLLKRTTIPTTVYKKQKMDRDDVIDITDFDTIAWLKTEMRMMLDEEIARACLIGDGRLSSSDDKINEQNIRPIWTDDDLFTIKSLITLSPSATDDDRANAFIKAAIKARKDYKGSGNPILFTTEENLTDMLLLTDATGRDLYDSIDKLTTKLRVRKIVTVPLMESKIRQVDSATHTLMGIIVNPSDYNIGADKGGAVNMFDDFDIDYNQQKYLIETRCSGALIRPYSAIAIEMTTTA